MEAAAPPPPAAHTRTLTLAHSQSSCREAAGLTGRGFVLWFPLPRFRMPPARLSICLSDGGVGPGAASRPARLRACPSSGRPSSVWWPVGVRPGTLPLDFLPPGGPGCSGRASGLASAPGRPSGPPQTSLGPAAGSSPVKKLGSEGIKASLARPVGSSQGLSPSRRMLTGPGGGGMLGGEAGRQEGRGILCGCLHWTSREQKLM